MIKKINVKLISVLFVMTLVLTGCNGGSESVKQETTKTESSQNNKSSENNAKVVEPLKLTMVGGSPNGLWSLFGESVGNILRESIPGTQYSYESGSGVSNIINVNSGEVPLGLAFNFEVMTALKGEEPFPQAYENTKVLTQLFNNQPYQVVMSKQFSEKYGINSFEDILKKKPPIRISTLKKGILIEKVSRNILEQYGITYDDIERWGGQVHHVNVGTSVGMIKDGKLDLFVLYNFTPNGALMELSNSKDIQLLSLNKDIQQSVAEEFGTPATVIPAGSFEWQNDDVISNNAGLMVLSDPKMSNEDAYLITKTLIENIDKLKALHVNMKDLTPEDMAELPDDIIHPGAMKYYKEAGLK